MKTAILAWGSLVWDKRILRIVGDWRTGGPVLPIEFSRISSDGRLTLVIDPTNGVPVPTLFARSELEKLDDAIANLREREETSSEKIGYVNLVANTARDYSRRQNPAACDTIRYWAQANGWEAVIWTALTSNFELARKEPFTAAVDYVGNLAGQMKTKALEYIRNAPTEVNTPVRRAISNLPEPEL
jgi:hypothetical protein